MADEATLAAPAVSAPVALPEATTKLDPVAAADAIMRGETPATPTTAEPAVPATPEPGEERLSSGFAALARQKAKLHQREQALKAEGAEITQLKELRTKMATDAAAVLDMFPGLTPQQALEKVATAYLERSQGAPAASTDDRVSELQARIDARDKAEKDARDAAARESETTLRTAAIDAGINVVKSVLAETPDAYPTITALGEHQQVFDALGAYAKKHNLSQDEITVDLLKKIAPAIEKQLAEEYSALVGKVPHIAARVATPRPNQSPTGNPTGSGAQGNSSSSLASTVVSGAPPHQPDRRFSIEELNRMALDMFKPATA